MKQDELAMGIGRASHWFQQNQKSIVNATLVIAGAALLLGGIYIYRSRQAETARALLADGLEQYHGVVGAGGEASSDTPRFAKADEKYKTALSSLEKVADDFSSYEAGRQARYYVGLCQYALKDFDAAESSLQKVRSGDRDLLYYLSSKALAAVKTDRGDHAAAAEIYRPLVDDAESPLPKDYVLFELAKAEERAGNLEQARQHYDRIVTDHPDSQLRSDAMTRSELIALESETAASGG